MSIKDEAEDLRKRAESYEPHRTGLEVQVDLSSAAMRAAELALYFKIVDEGELSEVWRQINQAIQLVKDTIESTGGVGQ